jgi:hypothetical protein
MFSPFVSKLEHTNSQHLYQHACTFSCVKYRLQAAISRAYENCHNFREIGTKGKKFTDMVFHLNRLDVILFTF